MKSARKYDLYGRVEKMEALWYALGTTGFTFFMTALGAAVVFFFRKDVSERFQNLFLGFAAGVMVAASVWSLLIPAMDQAKEAGGVGWIPAAGGFAAGGAFFLLLDHVIPHLHVLGEKPEGPRFHLGRSTMMILAVTLHNIPEGLAVGLSCALAAAEGTSSTAWTAALALGIGIGIQNFPEGAAISLPLKKEGISSRRAFCYGALSGIAEPIAGVLAVLIAEAVGAAMPWLLSFAAGAMVFVVAEELIPEANREKDSHMGTIGVMAGFAVMMILDVALG